MEEEPGEMGRTLILKDGTGTLYQIKHLLELEKVGKDREWGRFITATHEGFCLFCF